MCERAFLWKCVLRCGVHCTMYLSLTISNNSIGNIFDDRKKKIRKNKTHSYTHLGIKPTGATSYCQPEEIKTWNNIRVKMREYYYMCVLFCIRKYTNRTHKNAKRWWWRDKVLKTWTCVPFHFCTLSQQQKRRQRWRKKSYNLLLFSFIQRKEKKNFAIHGRYVVVAIDMDKLYTFYSSISVTTIILWFLFSFSFGSCQTFSCLFISFFISERIVCVFIGIPVSHLL